ncbi:MULTISPECIES: hypothetical protein [unclassified Pseudomonas]|uniref:hypothetical protein n=1 Tax=unclassified Pseudomonas TaxID=196821 RepID=UPI001F5AEB15|nr:MULTISPECIES: hypothetical protein [unclassified Pseudomonas]
MAKPPKKVAVTAAADTTVTTRPEPSGSGVHHGTPVPARPLPGIDSAPGSTASGTSVTRPPGITISEMPGLGSDTLSTARSAIAWPENRLNELTPVGENSGLFTGPDQRTYAQLGNEGRFIVEQDRQGNYYVPLTFAPGVPGPVVTRSEGLPNWHIQRPGWQPLRARSETPVTAQHPAYLLPEDANTLTRAELSSEGIRYNKLKQTFVDTAEGTVMVRKNHLGEYRYASATSRDLLDLAFEQIPGTLLWRQKAQAAHAADTPATDPLRPVAAPDEQVPGPGKRPRLDTSKPPEPLPTATRDTSVPTEQTPYFWLPWGHLNKPPVVESIQLGWFHYPIVPIGSNRTPKVYFVQHPDFAPAGFDAFETMLRTAPSLQPVATFRIGNDPGEVHPGKRFFEEPIAQSVANTFPDFSAPTAWAVAKKLYELADNSAVITGTGLVNIQAVLHQWKQKPFPTAPAYADPLNMLAVAPSIDAGGKKLIAMPPQIDSELQRLTFDPQRFPVEWGHYKTYPTDLNLRRLLGALLIRSGYDVFPLTHEHRIPTLVFRRATHDQVYFLKLGSVEHVGLSHTPGNELADPGLPARIGNDAFLALTTATAQNKVVWLIGGVLKVESNPDSVFIIRER